MRAALLALTATAALALPAGAQAATVRTTTECLPTVKGVVQGCLVFVHYTAAAGEANFLTVTAEGGALRIHDEGAPVEAQAECTQVDANTASCPNGSLEASLGDGDDRARGGNYTVRLGPGNDQATGMTSAFGDDGDDIILGTPNADRLFGGGGNDELDGLDGDDDVAGEVGTDVVRGGDGDDRLGAVEDGPGAADDFAGGGGFDTLSYDRETDDVEVNLATGATAGAALNDTISGIDNVIAGEGDDVLVGDERANKIEGGLGRNQISGGGDADELRGSGHDDTIDGGDGDDRVEGGGGTDALRGGPGDDLLLQDGRGTLEGGDGDDSLSSEGGRLRFACGAGEDVVDGTTLTAVGRDCEITSIGDIGEGRLAIPIPTGGRFALALVTAPAGDRGRIRLRQPGTRRTYGSARWAGRGRTRQVTVRIRLSRRALRRLRASGRLAVVLEATDLTTDVGATERLTTALVAS